MTEEELPKDDVDAAAALWLERLRDPHVTPEIFAAFRAWISCDPRHDEAFVRVGNAWDAFADHALAPDILGYRKDALGHAQQLRSSGTNRLWIYAAAVWLVLFASGAGALYFYLQQPKDLIYSTEVGQREHLVLSDNSQVDVDADSSVVVRFGKRERHVEVLRGQAYFQVAKERTRKFVVENRGRVVIATGTEFNVEALPDETRVVLAEGHVVVGTPGTNGGLAQKLAALSPGDILRLGPAGRMELKHDANVLALTAWRHGKLVFDDTPVGEAIADMARYTHQSVELGPGTASIRVSGVFAEGDLAGLLSALESYYGVKPERDAGGAVRLVRH